MTADPTVLMYLIAGIVIAIVLVLGWELSGRWAYVSSRSARRLKAAESVDVLEALSGLPKESLEHKLVESGLQLNRVQFYLLALGLFVTGTLLAWTFFIPGLPSIAVGMILGYLPFVYVEARAKSRGREIDKQLPLALSRIATGLQANHGLGQVLEKTGLSLLAEGANPLSPELIKASRDLNVMEADQALRDLARRSPSLSLSNVALLLESFHRAGGGQYADVVSETALAIQNIIAIRNHASAKASQPLQAAKVIPLILGFVLFVMLSDPVTRDSFRLPLAQVVIALAMGVMLVGYLIMRNEVMKVL